MWDAESFRSYTVTVSGNPSVIGSLHALQVEAVVPLASSLDNARRYGVRVPAFVISPWVVRGQVSHEVFDRTSLLCGDRRGRRAGCQPSVASL